MLNEIFKHESADTNTNQSNNNFLQGVLLLYKKAKRYMTSVLFDDEKKFIPYGKEELKSASPSTLMKYEKLQRNANQKYFEKERAQEIDSISSLSMDIKRVVFKDELISNVELDTDYKELFFENKCDAEVENIIVRKNPLLEITKSISECKL
jgi:hypothetical protein